MRTGSAVWQVGTAGVAGVEEGGGNSRPDPRSRGPATGAGAPDERRGDLALGRRVLAVATLAVLAVVCVVHAALPVTPFSLPGNGLRDYSRMVAPQGWAFFTRSPRLSNPVAVVRDRGGSWHRLPPGPIAAPGDLMGLDRARQARSAQIPVLVALVSKDQWTRCEAQPVDCLSRLPIGSTVANPSPNRLICGDIGLIVQEVLPWAWRDLPTVMPSRVVRMTVTC